MSANSISMKWVRRNLFATPADSLLTLVILPLIIWAAISLLHWGISVAKWHAVEENLRVLIVGTLPAELVPRVWGAAVLSSALVGITFSALVTASASFTMASIVVLAFVGLYASYSGGSTATYLFGCMAVGILAHAVALKVSSLRKYAAVLWCLGFLAIMGLVAPAGWDRVGGLMMSVLFTLAASVLSIPLGVALAFGRRSRFAGVQVICTSYIEVMRSLPLILVVYCIWVVTPLLSPEHPGPDLVRGLFGFTLFFAAYVAEYVRSGLQSVPKGQVEAAQSLGMTPYYINRDVVLPQALRVVVPALVGNVLDVFNTVPLLFIIGITDFLRAGQMVLVNPQSGGYTYEIYLFMFTVYLAIASVVTFGARRLEAKMASGHR
ncbi:amino acid ABC transporter permease [Herbaspirillum sp. DW155]|uniref:amino acid ABC transporter permease n=1 Tax=Herbaspirillum sp. DW155 TaxID=3095609 RepID=UPI0030892558|nr:amino acid ABC transporter permease [Herbaspirillum sp. DW155]